MKRKENRKSGWRQYFTLAISGLAITLIVPIAGASSSSVSARAEDPIGGYIAIGRPYPQLLGLNVAYNITEDIRVQLGHGKTSIGASVSINESGANFTSVSVETIGLGAEYFFTDWKFRPGVGLSVSQNSYEGSELDSLYGMNKSNTQVLASAGFDLQANSGFQFAVGAQSVVSGEFGGSGGYLSGGYFF